MNLAIASSLSLILTPYGLLSILGGVLCGIFVGVMPGLSSVMGMAIMLPVALTMSGDYGILMMLGIFCGAIYGGSITAILINTPGTANSAATCLDGHPLALKHQAGRAISISTTASTFGGLFSTFMLLWTSPVLCKFALSFSAQESFALALFGISIVAGISSQNIVKGIMGALIGLLLATIGVDSTTGVYRFTFGTVYLTGGISNIPVLIGLFAFSQGLINIEENFKTKRVKVQEKLERILPSGSDLRRIFPTLIRSSVIGTIIGAIPGTGGDIAAWVGYNEAKRWSKHPEEFGHGAIDGVAGPEAANNAISGGALIPLLSLGIPGDACTAIMLGCLMMLGITPGPLLMSENPEKVYLIILGMFAANIFMAICGFGGIKIFTKISSVPEVILDPLIFVFCFVGTFAVNHTIGDVYLMIICGILGYFLIKMDFSVPPIILGMILGNILEKNFRRSLVLAGGDWTTFFTRPISCIFIVLSVLSVFYPFVLPLVKERAARKKAIKAGGGTNE
ncbi:C4-dicarboxylate ABC transporter permease [Caproiciproducens sp. NJN-50]|uniref:tripartite tricarboxylate transporter permease n=1 Tax=Acutalibacteraceae TaxID=3082771 RepID=UPI000FFE1775|nr:MULTISPECIES: tripartite tricarboxylate transporter permease [Acutalibacteraceae]QAT50044.1 C4-dicarboxylate ABC transporter permease [Caproiciproducens sp. NJN-50]